MPRFLFTTGIENSYPTIRLPDGRSKRVDEMEKCGHYRSWREDFELAAGMGIQALRYGPPYHLTHLESERYDWSFADETFTALQQLGILPIVDLCHFGVPDWIGSFQNSEWPAHFARYARAFAERYPWVRLYTPVNEIFVAATFSALYGWWNECLQSERAFVTAIKHLCQANVLAMRAILEVQPLATFIQSESTEHFHAEEPCCEEKVAFLNERRFLALDLTYGHACDVTMYDYLLDHGLKREEYHWFRRQAVKSRCVMGNDYYATNEHLVHRDGSVSPAGDVFGYYVLTKQYFDRYRLPVMHTETNCADPGAVAWLRKQWANMIQLRKDGIPIVGFTWYCLTDQVDWDTALREDAGCVNPLGLYDLDRRERPVGAVFRHLIEQWRQILPTESNCLQICCLT